MNKAYSIVVAAGAAVALFAFGYWWGTREPRQMSAVAETSGQKGEAKGIERKVLYYRNPMGLPDTSPTPKKDSMGMDYIPVYEGEEPQGPGVKIGLDKVQKLGVRTEKVVARSLERTVRAVGKIDVDERARRTVAPRFEGWIQQLHVNATGQFVQRGQPLMEVYSPELVTAQQEYLVAVRGVADLKSANAEFQARMGSVAEGGLQRLRNWEIGEEEIARLRDEERPRNTLTLRSPVSGVVLEKAAVQGMRFMPGEMLYRIADLSTVWLLADVFEQDLGLVRVGQTVKVHVNAYPDKAFLGRVSFVYPTVAPETRTAKIRVELANPRRLLKPEMYASVEFAAGGAARRLAVPDSAVLDSGTRQIVLVRRGEGLFEPRPVKLGARADGYVEALDGVKEGDEVVVSANFLIDAESNLKAAIAGFGSAAPGDRPKAAAEPITHAADGRVESVDVKAGTASISHEPVPSLKWPAMTMDFKVKDAAVLRRLQARQKIRFDFAEQAPGEWVVVRVQPATAAGDPHKGH